MVNSLLQILCIPLIIFVVMGVMAVYKRIVKSRGEALTRLIPIWSAILGAFLSTYLFMKFPALTLATDVLGAMLLGGVFGLAAVGLYQVGRQISKMRTLNDVTTDKVLQSCPMRKTETTETTNPADKG